VDVDGRRTPLLDAPLVSPGLGWDATDDSLCEWAAGVLVVGPADEAEIRRGL
jgi:hypothetical protein